jgi:hypothetical protein
MLRDLEAIILKNSGDGAIEHIRLLMDLSTLLWQISSSALKNLISMITFFGMEFDHCYSQGWRQGGKWGSGPCKRKKPINHMPS